MFEKEILGIVLGILQGLFEWIPVSSEGQLVIVLSQIWKISTNNAISLALFAHIGTALVIFIYYRKEYLNMIKAGFTVAINWFSETIHPEAIQRTITPKEQRDFNLFLRVAVVTIATVPTAFLSLFLLEDILNFFNDFLHINSYELITAIVGIFLIITGLILHYRPKLSEEISTEKQFSEIPLIQAIILGLLQGFTALPGISRSGITVTYLLTGSKLDQNESLKASFLVGAPVTLGAGFLQVVRGKIFFFPSGIADETNTIIMSYLGAFLLILAAFIVGAITLKAFLELARKTEFDYFLIIFGMIALLAVVFAPILASLFLG